MPQPGGSQPHASADDSFLDLLVETLEGVDESVRGNFLRQYFRTTAQIDLSEAESNDYWERILMRRRELSETIGKRVSLRTAMVDVLASANFLRVPILMEYEEFKKLQINAATDALTGLYNRRLFDEYCDKELNRAKRYSQQLAIVILDMHQLKQVNDRYGHLRGDQVLQLAATTLRKTLRASDFAFRIGGDEFALLLPQTEPEQAETLCRRVRAQYEADVKPMQLDVGVTLDFGVAVLPQDGDQKSALMSLADQRLYTLKNATRSGARVISMESTATREKTAEAARTAEAAQTPSQSQPSSQSSQSPDNPARTQTPAGTQRPWTGVLTSPLSGGGTPSRATKPADPTPITTPAAERKAGAEHRRWERITLTDTKSYAVLSELNQQTATVLNLSYGGVALLMDREEDLPNQFNAVLHVPILPPVRVILRKAYATRTDSGRARVGCAFVS
jgi:diguanylate cyclase (GGDEF)-like protein